MDLVIDRAISAKSNWLLQISTQYKQSGQIPERIVGIRYLAQ